MAWCGKDLWRGAARRSTACEGMVGQAAVRQGPAARLGTAWCGPARPGLVRRRKDSGPASRRKASRVAVGSTPARAGWQGVPDQRRQTGPYLMARSGKHLWYGWARRDSAPYGRAWSGMARQGVAPPGFSLRHGQVGRGVVWPVLAWRGVARMGGKACSPGLGQSARTQGAASLVSASCDPVQHGQAWIAAHARCTPHARPHRGRWGYAGAASALLSAPPRRVGAGGRRIRPGPESSPAPEEETYDADPGRSR